MVTLVTLFHSSHTLDHLKIFPFSRWSIITARHLSWADWYADCQLLMTQKSHHSHTHHTSHIDGKLPISDLLKTEDSQPLKDWPGNCSQLTCVPIVNHYRPIHTIFTLAKPQTHTCHTFHTVDLPKTLVTHFSPTSHTHITHVTMITPVSHWSHSRLPWTSDQSAGRRLSLPIPVFPAEWCADCQWPLTLVTHRSHNVST